MLKFGITGASGVIGRILCAKLQQNGIDFSIFTGDIRNKEDIQKWIKNNDWDGVIQSYNFGLVIDDEDDEKKVYVDNVLMMEYFNMEI